MKERLVICNEEDTDSRARVTTNNGWGVDSKQRSSCVGSQVGWLWEDAFMQLKSYTGATKYTTTTSTTSYCITETVFLNHAISLSTHYRTVLLEQPKVSHAANTFPECFEASLVVTFQIPIQLQQKRFIFIPSDPPPMLPYHDFASGPCCGK